MSADCQADHLVEVAACLACVARNLRNAFFIVVEFFEGGHRNKKIVFLEANRLVGRASARWCRERTAGAGRERDYDPTRSAVNHDPPLDLATNLWINLTFLQTRAPPRRARHFLLRAIPGRSTPAASMTKVLRSMPRHLLPLHVFILMTLNSLHAGFVSIAEQNRRGNSSWI